MDDEMQNMAEQIRQEVESVMGIKINIDTEMVSQKLLDSINAIDLALALEDRFGIVIDTPEIKPENFETCRTLARFVLDKRR